MIRPLVLSLILAGTTLGTARAETVTLDFLPPTMEPRDVCGRPGPGEGAVDETTQGDAPELTDIERIAFLRADIRNYLAEDANRFFEFIDALITRRTELDTEFTEIDAALARIDLWLRAGRLEGLREAGLVEALRGQAEQMTNNQRVALARFYDEGLGVAPDRAFAQELIREAAYGGNARALLEIARLAQQGTLIEGWDAPLDLTVTMAFGGMLGALDSGVCRRAMQIAQAYLRGDVVTRNPALALAWFRFAADMGHADAAWRVVEYYLAAEGPDQDNVALRRYLEQAVRLGIAVPDDVQVALVSSRAITADELAAMLGPNRAQDAGRTGRDIASRLELNVDLDGEDVEGVGERHQYRREISQMPEAPGRVFELLARDVLIGKGRWAAEAEAMALREEAVRRGDGEAKRRLAKMLVRYRDDPAQIARAESLLMEAVARHGLAQGMRDLDTLYRCQVVDAPRTAQAAIWARNYRASGHALVQATENDLLALSPHRAPEALARIQGQALDRRAIMISAQAHLMQANPLSGTGALDYWARALNRSRPALEDFAKLDFELAASPAEREVALELFRRIYLHNGVQTALDLSLALVTFNGRDPQIAEQIEGLLRMAGNRGEGASIRLLARLQGNEPEIYAEFAETIEERGDFLALMFAIPHIPDNKVDDYIDRAVSLMACGSKDAAELGEAHAIRGQAELSHHWRVVGLTFEGGHVLSKLRLTEREMRNYNRGAAPDTVAAAMRALADGDTGARLRLVALTANAALESYDAQAAVDHVLEALARNEPDDLAVLAGLLRDAPQDVRDGVAARADMASLLAQAAAAGDMEARFELGMLLRARATAPAGLAQAMTPIKAAAEAGHRDAMFEWGRALGIGLGIAEDTEEALNWLDQAAGAGHPRAAELAALLRLRTGQ